MVDSPDHEGVCWGVLCEGVVGEGERYVGDVRRMGLVDRSTSRGLVTLQGERWCDDDLRDAGKSSKVRWTSAKKEAAFVCVCACVDSLPSLRHKRKGEKLLKCEICLNT